MESVTKNTRNPESTLPNKHNAIAYHLCREAVATGIIRVAKDDTATNLADLLTKQMSKERRKDLMFKSCINYSYVGFGDH